MLSIDFYNILVGKARLIELRKEKCLRSHEGQAGLEAESLEPDIPRPAFVNSILFQKWTCLFIRANA